MATIEVASFGASVAVDGKRVIVGTPAGAKQGFSIEDLDLLVLQVPAVSVSGGALAALAETGVPVMVCGANHVPMAWVHPIGGRAVFDPDRAARQAGLPERSRARLWGAIVRAKIARQADVLREADGPEARMRRLADSVENGDPANTEATAAQIYWPGLFGRDFRRRGGNAVSGALDWGYAVLRALVCRAIVSAGLHPGIGLFHRAAGNPFVLADDLIEPFRPTVDRLVWRLWRTEALLPPALWKPALAAVGDEAVAILGQRMRCKAAVQQTVDSLARTITDGKGALVLPERLTEAADAERVAEDVAGNLL